MARDPCQKCSYLGVNLNEVDIRPWSQTHGFIWHGPTDNIWIEDDKWVVFRGNKCVATFVVPAMLFNNAR
jgi:hypothetical protein